MFFQKQNEIFRNGAGADDKDPRVFERLLLYKIKSDGGEGKVAAGYARFIPDPFTGSKRSVDELAKHMAKCSGIPCNFCRFLDLSENFVFAGHL